MKILDSLIRKKSWGSVKLTHKKVTSVGYNEREEPSFEDSTITTSTFYASEGQTPDYNNDQKFKDFGVLNQNLRVFHVPSNIAFNEFVNDGVRDRIYINSIAYEIFSIDTDSMWRSTQVQIYLRPLT